MRTFTNRFEEHDNPAQVFGNSAGKTPQNKVLKVAMRRAAGKLTHILITKKNRATAREHLHTHEAALTQNSETKLAQPPCDAF